MSQANLFLISALIGAIVGLIYDCFRVFRIAIKHSWLATQLEDALYWGIAAFLVFNFMLNATAGEIRVYMIFGVALGMVIYFSTLSHLIMKVSVAIVEFFKKVIVAILRILLFPIKIIVDLMAIPLRYATNVTKKSKKPIKKLLQNSKKCVTIGSANVAKNLHIIFKKV